MASQHLIDTKHTTWTPHLDGYLKGIRDEFDRLNHELDETRKQRDEYITQYKSQVEELQELRQKIFSRENNTGTQHGQEAPDNPPLMSSASSAGEYLDGDDVASNQLPNQENAKETGHLEGEENQEGDNPGEGDGPSRTPEANIPPANKPVFSAWDVEPNPSSTATLNLNLVHKLTIKGMKRVTFSMDGKHLAAASSLGVVSIFDTRTGKRISAMKNLYHDEKSLPAYTCLGFSPHSKYLATGEIDDNVRIWIISQRRVRNTFRHRTTVKALNFSPNGQCIVTCSLDETVIIWRLRDGFSRVLTASGFYPRSIHLSLDGQYIASGDFHGNMLLRNMRTGSLVAGWRGHNSLVASLMFSPDGKSLLSGSWDNRVIQWDTSFLNSLGMVNPPISGMEVSHLIGHTNWIASVSISPDGKWIASGSRDHTVNLECP